MPKRITYQLNGSRATRLPIDIFLSLNDIKVALADDVYCDLSGTDNVTVIKDYCLALTRKRVDEKVAKWVSINGTKSLNQACENTDMLTYLYLVDPVVNRLYPELSV